ncbi:MAG: rhodanese-like domain-containing protein [Rhodocyclaceae bacterium]|nr:rhodanese-like domain-containing protein [Rhodocyclaceae bacterium]
MSETVLERPAATLHPILEARRSEAERGDLGYAGGVTPADAWALAQTGAARLIDVRSNEELVFVGRVPDALHVAWATGTSLNRNPRFAKELEQRAGGKDVPLLLICRSGKRSVEAAKAATAAGFSAVFNVLEGFEGELDDRGRRGNLDGWRRAGLPWYQD